MEGSPFFEMWSAHSVKEEKKKKGCTRTIFALTGSCERCGRRGLSAAFGWSRCVGCGIRVCLDDCSRVKNGIVCVECYT